MTEVSSLQEYAERHLREKDITWIIANCPKQFPNIYETQKKLHKRKMKEISLQIHVLFHSNVSRVCPSLSEFTQYIIDMRRENTIANRREKRLKRLKWYNNSAAFWEHS